MSNDLQRQIETDRRASSATCLSMSITIGTLAITPWLPASTLKAGIIFIVIGLVAQAISNLTALLLIGPLARGSRWANVALLILQPVVPYAVGTYMAGIVLLLLAGILALWRLVI